MTIELTEEREIEAKVFKVDKHLWLKTSIMRKCLLTLGVRGLGKLIEKYQKVKLTLVVGWSLENHSLFFQVFVFICKTLTSCSNKTKKPK